MGHSCQSNSVRNWPGVFEETGKQIISSVREQAIHRGAQIFSTVVVDVDVMQYRPLFRIKSSRYAPCLSYQPFSHANGDYFNGVNCTSLGIPGEDKLFGKGIYTCAVCESSLVRDGIVGVVGGGDSAIATSLYLVPLVKKVYVFVRGDKFCAKDITRVQELLAHTKGNQPRVEILFHTKITNVESTPEGKFASVQLATPLRQWQQKLDALFLAIGILPNTELFPTLVKRPDGTIQTFRYQETSQPGIFAAGDVTDNVFRQAITGAGEGCKCALQVKTHLDQQKLSRLSDFKATSFPLVVNVSQGKIQIEPFSHESKTNSTCKSETCSPQNIYDRKGQSPSQPTIRSQDEQEQPIQEILSLKDWKSLVDKFPKILLEVMSGNCLTCGSLEFVLQDLPSHFPDIRFARVDMELVDPKELEALGSLLDIPKKIELPYFAKILHGQNIASIQGEEQTSKSKLYQFLQR